MVQQAAVKSSPGKQLSQCRATDFDYQDFINYPLITTIEKIRLPWIVFGTVFQGRRQAKNIKSLFAVTVDIDEGDLTKEQLILKIQDLGYTAYFHSTYSAFYGKAPAKWRVIFPLKTEWKQTDGIETWKSIVKALWQKFDVIPDTACQDPSRLWFSPARRPDQRYQTGHVALREIDWKSLISESDKSNGANGSDSTPNYEAQILTGEHFHEAMRHLTMSLVGQGKNFQEVYTYARDLLDNSDAKDTHHIRHLDWQNYRNDLKRLVEGAFQRADTEPTYEPILTQRLPRFDDVNVIPRDHIWQGYLMKQMVTAIVAPGGTGKSMLSLQMAISVALGRDLLFEDTEVKQSNVLMLNGEDNIEEIARRIIGIKKYYNLTLDLNEHIHIHEQIGSDNRVLFLDRDANPTRHVKDTIDYCNDYDIRTVIVDPNVQFHSVNENANEDTAKLLAIYTQIAKKTNGAVAIIHHTRKNKDDPQDNARGASAFRDGCRLLFNMRNMNDSDIEICANVDPQDWWKYTTMEAIKANYTPHSKKVWLEKDSFDIVDGSDDDYSCFVLQPVDIKRIKEDNKEVGEEERMLEAIAECMIEDGTVMVNLTKAGSIIRTIKPQIKVRTSREKASEILPLGQTTSVKTSKGMMYLLHSENKEGRSNGIRFVEK